MFADASAHEVGEALFLVEDKLWSGLVAPSGRLLLGAQAARVSSGPSALTGARTVLSSLSGRQIRCL